MMRKSVVFLAVCVALSLSAFAQGNPLQCTLLVAPASGAAPLPVTATVNCTDSAAPITLITLDWGDGSPQVQTTQSSFSVQHTYGTPGSYVVTVTATDALLNTAVVTQGVTVTAPPPPPPRNQPPTCTLTVAPTTGTAPLTVTATGSCTDPDGDTLSEVLDWGDHTTTNGTNGTHTYNARGRFTVTLTATDSGGLTGSATQTVNVNKNQTPTCTLNVTPNSGPAPLTVTAAATCTDTDGDTLVTSIAWGDSTTTNGTTGTHTYNTSGSFTVTVTATDIAGNTGTASQAVTEASSTPSCTLQASPSSGNAPLVVTVTANCTDAGNDLSTVLTDFGDGFYLTGNGSSHTYVSGGSYTVTVTAHDKAGNSSQPVSTSVTVSDNPVLFVGAGNGQVQQFSRSGNKQTTLNSNQGGSMTGMALDSVENLYTTDFTADTVSKFNGSNTPMGTFGSGYNCKPESIVFDRAGNAYVGETGCSHAILKFDAYGNLMAAYSVTTEQEGSDWIDLASDGCTIFYTSQGSSVLRYNACARQQMPSFATGLNTALAVKILPDQSVLVADKQDIVRFDSAGRKIMTYTASGENCWVSLALDSDNASFWAADYCSSDVVQFNINSGNEVSKFNSGMPANTVYGLTERVDPSGVTPAGPLSASPAQASVTGGQSTTFTLNFAPNGGAAGQTFTFSCASLPANSSCSFSPATLLAGGGPLSTQLTITTAGASAQLALPRKAAGWMLALALPCFGIIFVFGDAVPRRRKRFLPAFLLLACLLALFACSGASGSSSASPPPSGPTSPPTPGSTTPSGAYKVVIHATASGGRQSSTAVSLTVQ
ncbi:MAG: PKD domain-containing protein [Acidobacteriota bacterium]